MKRTAHREKFRLERNLGFVVGCMPILRPLFATVLKINADRNERSWNWYRKGQDEMLELDVKAWENIVGDTHPALLPEAVTRTSMYEE